MTVEAPDFDSDLIGHSAVDLEQETGSVCHAVVSSFSEGAPVQMTECGQRLQGEIPEPRKTFDTSEYEMCPECWPESLTEMGN